MQFLLIPLATQSVNATILKNIENRFKNAVFTSQRFMERYPYMLVLLFFFLLKL